MFTKNRLILILGIWIALLPFLGLPIAWKNFFYVICGLAIATLSFMVARHKRIVKRGPHKKERSNEVFAQAAPSIETFVKDEVTESEVSVPEALEQVIEEPALGTDLDTDGEPKQ